MKLKNKLLNLFRSFYIYDNVLIESRVKILPFAVLGAPINPEDLSSLLPLPKTVIGKNSYVSSFAIIYEGAQIGENVFIEPYCRIGAKSRIGKNSRLIYGSRIHDNVTIGDSCIIAGNCSDSVVVGNNVNHFGRIAHKFNSPKNKWEETDEPSPIIEDDAVIGANALIIGPITIGKNSYVAGGEIVRKSIPPFHIFYGGKIYSKEEWNGTLRTNLFFGNEGD